MIGPARAPAIGPMSEKKPPVCKLLPICQTLFRIYVLFFSFHYDSSSLYNDLNVYVLYFNDIEPSCSE